MPLPGANTTLLLHAASCRRRKQRRLIAPASPEAISAGDGSPLWAGPSANRGRRARRRAPLCCWCRPVGAGSAGARAWDTRRSCCQRTCHNLGAHTGGGDLTSSVFDWLDFVTVVLRESTIYKVNTSFSFFFLLVCDCFLVAL